MKILFLDAPGCAHAIRGTPFFCKLQVMILSLLSLSLTFCRQILLASEIMVLVGIILSFRVTRLYSVPQYVCSALITFVSAEVLEGNL